MANDPTKHPVAAVQPLLMTTDPDHHYVFLACLLALDPVLWVGSDPSIPPQLSETEVHRVMSFLDDHDTTIRHMVRSA